PCFAIRVPGSTRISNTYFDFRMVLLISSYQKAGSTDRTCRQCMIDAALDMALQHGRRLRRVARDGAFAQDTVFLGGDVPPEGQGDHLVAQILVEDGRMRIHEHLRAAGGNECLVEFPVIALPKLGAAAVA